jgi:hypothetical protein
MPAFGPAAEGDRATRRNRCSYRPGEGTNNPRRRATYEAAEKTGKADSVKR